MSRGRVGTQGDRGGRDGRGSPVTDRGRENPERTNSHKTEGVGDVVGELLLSEINK